MLIDGVFSGGGLKGFALVGAYEVLEEKGYQFKRVAGTSAGAILASFIAAGYTAKEIERLFDDLDLTSLLDSRLTMLPFPLLKWLHIYWRLGLYQGKELEKWFLEKLADKGVYSFSDLPEGSLKLVASDLTNGRMIVLPDDLERYGIAQETFPVARAVRMSCGIPFFFEPVRLKVGSGDTIVVDGGVLSNFPMWIFDNDVGKRDRPVLGLKLSRRKEEMEGRQIKNAINLFEALFSTMKNAHDEKYISRKHEKNIVFIPVENYSATQFDLDEESKRDLLDIGRKRTELFLNLW
ncbi:patatin-like phospholipase family protein [Sporosarcina sp. Marseille-Q4063]|uniref:patatin-like phospholipase family protein n=1 Tax=Sporosarcina sp. Marseille-Q4063 TaxID=2810514 RepID=UPI001BB023C3|nr:patatin-like phospholipase family protein [Sporosarcina sp. Marseille-Q4063]QUW22444.1 patatin-like phospholipase family protein [Sporosarcina sp. Marseille-Q4063]